MCKKYLILSNGRIFEGQGFGFDGKATGEAVFNTAAVGYTEMLTDPAYCGQIVVQTFPSAGNYGLSAQDFESPIPRLCGYVVREYCDEPSNFRSEMTLDKFLKDHKIPAICGIDTREITELLRDNGSMAACICDEATPDIVQSLKGFVPSCRPEDVTGEKTVYLPEGEPKFNVAMIDYGAPKSLVETLTSRGCKVTSFPCTCGADEIESINPDGIFLSTGPGDPAQCANHVEVIKQIAGKRPVFGVGLGHELFALSQNAKTYKLPYGHHGASQPVRSNLTGRVLVTSQNHGYAVDMDSLPKGATVTHININDNSCEGIDYPYLMAYTLQFPPEACPAPTEVMQLTDKFCRLMEEQKCR